MLKRGEHKLMIHLHRTINAHLRLFDCIWKGRVNLEYTVFNIFAFLQFAAY